MSIENTFLNGSISQQQDKSRLKEINKNSFKNKNTTLRDSLDLEEHTNNSEYNFNSFSKTNFNIEKPIQSNTKIEVNKTENQSSELGTKESTISQIISGTYRNKKVLGLEIDYTNKKIKRLQGSKNLTSGADFDKFNMYGGRKRCIVNLDGSIKKFIISEDNIENEMVMVYQPAFYYLRVPISTTKLDNGIRIDKEHIYVADKQYDEFKLHPAFYDKDGHETKYILLSAFESGTYRTKFNTFELEDKQDIDLTNDRLVSTINSIPISGIKQNFTIESARTMAKNNGEGWDLFDLKALSAQQLLMIIEYGALDMQSEFNLGSSQVDGSASYNNASITGSTLFLNNKSGQATSTTNKQDTIRIYNEEGQCSISYRGVENPYGNIWQYVDGLKIKNGNLVYNDITIDFKIPTTNGWVSAFGYDKDFDWIFMPIASESSHSFIGDYMFAQNDSKTYNCVVGGTARAKYYSGLFCYGFEASGHTRNYSARIVHIPEANSTIEKANYQLWLTSNT